MTRPDEDLAPDDHLEPGERDTEAPIADAAEQAMPANPAHQGVELSRGLEVGEWDAYEQTLVVDLDDEYDR